MVIRGRKLTQNCRSLLQSPHDKWTKKKVPHQQSHLSSYSGHRWRSDVRESCMTPSLTVICISEHTHTETHILLQASHSPQRHAHSRASRYTASNVARCSTFSVTFYFCPQKSQLSDTQQPELLFRCTFVPFYFTFPAPYNRAELATFYGPLLCLYSMTTTTATHSAYQYCHLWDSSRTTTINCRQVLTHRKKENQIDYQPLCFVIFCNTRTVFIRHFDGSIT